MPDAYDRQLGMLIDLPDTVKTKASIIRTVPPLGVGGTSLHVVQTVRQQQTRTNKRGEEVGFSRDTIFLEVVTSEGTQRLVIPPEVANVIARQRDALSTKLRSRAAKTVAAGRKERGERPAFLKKAAGGA
jgi:hypothetical protein